MIIGSHVSNNGIKMLEGSVLEALKYDANCLMVYLGAPQNTFRKNIKEQNIEKAKILLKANNIKLEHVIVHAPYIVNLANPDIEKSNFATEFLTKELKMTEDLGLSYMVLHPGAHVGTGVEKAIEKIAKGINYILNNTTKATILLETMAGKGTEIGRNFKEIKMIMDLIEQKDRIGVCLDTCHIHDGGYDIVNDYENVKREFDEIIGLDKIKVIHLNDSKNECNSHKDRHENIGYGKIGFATLAKIAHDETFKDIPKILETPYITLSKLESYPPYYEEIKMLKSNIFNNELIETVIKNKK